MHRQPCVYARRHASRFAGCSIDQGRGTSCLNLNLLILPSSTNTSRCRSSFGGLVSPSWSCCGYWTSPGCLHWRRSRWRWSRTGVNMFPFPLLVKSIVSKLSSSSKWNPNIVSGHNWSQKRYSGWLHICGLVDGCSSDLNMFDTILKCENISLKFYWCLWNIKVSSSCILMITNRKIFSKGLLVYCWNWCRIEFCNFCRLSFL